MSYFSLRSLLFFFLLALTSTTKTFSQEIKIGFQDSIKSEVLNESRRFLIRLPDDYYSSEKSYPVIYRLDGEIDLFIETVGVIHRLAYMEECIPDMIVVMIENIDRNRDMMPVKTGFFQAEPGAENFKLFIENELIPHITSSYRTSNEKLFCGQSLSSLFALYYFLTSPDSFASYIACSAGFPDCEDYFISLTKDMLKTKQNETKKIFLTYGSKDFLDPNGIIIEQIQNFTKVISSDENIDYYFHVYPEEGHVPYPSLYHALKFIYE